MPSLLFLHVGLKWSQWARARTSFPSSQGKLFALLTHGPQRALPGGHWQTGITCLSTVVFSMKTAQALQEGYGSSFGASACDHWLLESIPEFFSPEPTLFTYVVSKESLVSLGRNNSNTPRNCCPMETRSSHAEERLPPASCAPRVRFGKQGQCYSKNTCSFINTEF